MNVEAICLDVALAMPCGLIVNELITNSLKHAFPPGFERQPGLRVHLRREAEGFVLVVADNGVGLPPGPMGQAGRTLGLRLVNLWVHAISWRNGRDGQRRGRVWTLRFNAPNGRPA